MLCTHTRGYFPNGIGGVEVQRVESRGGRLAVTPVLTRLDAGPAGGVHQHVVLSVLCSDFNFAQEGVQGG